MNKFSRQINPLTTQSFTLINYTIVSIMSELKKNTPTMTKDKIAVMSALNIVSSYLKQEEELNQYSDVSDEINNLQKSLQDFGAE